MKQWLLKYKKILAAVSGLLFILFCFYLYSFTFDFSGSQAPAWGVTFSVKYAKELDLDWKEAYLAILDDLERSVEAAKTKHQDYDAFLKGIELVMARVYELLRKHHIKPINAAGKKFDPHFHEPLMQEETDKAAEGTVIEEFQKGYMLNDKVIRTSKVKVAKAKNTNKNELK